MKYELVVDNNLLSFNHRITERLNEGWELHGFPFVQYNPKSHPTEQEALLYCQAVIKQSGYEEAENLFKYSAKVATRA